MTKKIIVNKFGGGILKKEFFPIIIKRIKEQLRSGYYPIVVVSAMPGITDKLIAPKSNFINELRKIHTGVMYEMSFEEKFIINVNKELEDLYLVMADKTILEDKLISCGEKISATIISAYLNFNNIKAHRIFAEDIPIVTDNNFGNANIDYKTSEKNAVRKLKKSQGVPVIAGFTGVTEDGLTTTLGRGGTDTTACFIGAALHASKIILWKDVGGVLSADPKIIPEAKTLSRVNYQEAEEAGKIIHDKAIQYAKMFGTPVEIASLLYPKLNTKVVKINESKKGAKIVNYKKNLTLFVITDEVIKGSELLSIVSQIFFKNKTDVILISNTRYSLQIVAENGSHFTHKILHELRQKVYKVEFSPVSMVYLIGNFDVKYVNAFNSSLIKMKTDLEISAFLYKNCTRIEAIIREDKIEPIIKSLYNEFIK